jgi:hypothetical protein
VVLSALRAKRKMLKQMLAQYATSTRRLAEFDRECLPSVPPWATRTVMSKIEGVKPQQVWSI